MKCGEESNCLFWVESTIGTTTSNLMVNNESLESIVIGYEDEFIDVLMV